MITGSINAHCPSDKSLGYGLRSVTSSDHQNDDRRPRVSVRTHTIRRRQNHPKTHEPPSDSKTKTKRALDTVTELVAAGEQVTIARVARKAAVSTWFVYNCAEVHRAARAAMQEQARHGLPAAAVIPQQRVSEASLHTDLALAHGEIKELKTERDRLRERVRFALGAEIDNVQRTELLERISDLESRNALLVAELAEQTKRAGRLERRTLELEDEVTAVRRALTRTIRAVPSPQQ